MTQPRRQVRELKQGDVIEQTFLLRDRELRRTPSGSSYLAGLLSDRTGTVATRWWKATEAEATMLSVGSFVQVKGRVESHRGQLQVIADELEMVASTDELIDTLLPRTAGESTAMWQELLNYLGEVSNLHLRRLIDEFLADDALVNRFQRVPAGTKLHHSVIGGLLEHTLAVVRLARAAGDLYGDVINRDLLLTGAFLHDVGKTAELDAEGSFRYTERGNLIGHIAMGIVMIQQKVEAIERRTGHPFPTQVLNLVQHLLVSHHGSQDRGSPKQPMTPEALVLHALDDLDTRVNMAQSAITNHQDDNDAFTHYHRALGALIYRFSTALADDDQ